MKPEGVKVFCSAPARQWGQTVPSFCGFLACPHLFWCHLRPHAAQCYDPRVKKEQPAVCVTPMVMAFWNMGVGALLKEGVPLVGPQTAPPGYKQQLVTATMTEKE